MWNFRKGADQYPTKCPQIVKFYLYANWTIQRTAHSRNRGFANFKQHKPFNVQNNRITFDLISLHLLLILFFFFSMMHQKEIRQGRRQLFRSNATRNNRNTTPGQPGNTKMEKQKLLDIMKIAEHLTAKENKTKFIETAGLNEILASVHNTTQTKSAKETTLKINRLNNKLTKMFDSSPNKTKKKESYDPDWNKNSIVGYKRKHKFDFTSMNNGEVLGNDSEIQEMLDGRSNSSQDIQKQTAAKK